MSPVEQLTADRPLVPALALARPRARALVVVAVLVLAGLSFLAPSAPTYDPWAWIVWGREVLHLDLSTVGGPSWKPLPVLLDDAVRAGRAARARPLALRRAGGRAGRRGRRLRPRAPPRRRGRGRVRGGRGLRGGALDDPQRRAGQLRGPARRAARWAPSTATWRAGGAPPSRSGSARRSCGPRRGRSSASTARSCSGASPPCGASWPAASSCCPCCGCCPSCGGRATCCGRCTARRPRAPTAPPSRRTRRAPCSTSSRPC